MSDRSRDPYVVATAPLSRIVRQFVDDWRRDRPNDGSTSRDNGLRPFGAVSWLAQESRLPRETIRRVIEGASDKTEYRIAEPIVGRALERPELFHDGTLVIEANPRVKPEVRAAVTAELNGSAAPPKS